MADGVKDFEVGEYVVIASSSVKAVTWWPAHTRDFYETKNNGGFSFQGVTWDAGSK